MPMMTFFEVWDQRSKIENPDQTLVATRDHPASPPRRTMPAGLDKIDGSRNALDQSLVFWMNLQNHRCGEAQKYQILNEL